MKNEVLLSLNNRVNSQFMEEWKEYKISDLYDVHNGLSKGGKFFGSGYPFLSFKSVFNHYFIPNTLSDLVNASEKERLAFNIKRGDVFITRTSENAEELGMSCVALKDYPDATYNGFTKRLRPKNDVVVPEYIGYYLRSSFFRSFFYGLASSMSTRASLSNGDLLNMTVKLPPVSTQKGIASILKSFDDKIECNKLINDNLQQQARALYKSWFVDFDPFKDGQFEDSELGMIPHGWSVKQLGEITSQVSERVKERVDVKVLSPITTGELVLSEEYFSKQVFSESISKYIVVKPSDFAYNPARVNIGSLGMNEYGFDGCVSPVYVVFRCEDGYQYFFDLFRRTEAFKEEVRTRAIGGVRQSLAYKDFSLIKVVYPPIDVIHSFNQVYSRILAKTKHNNEETARLASLRDTLLPKLMSGELKTNELTT